jgi:two-component system sensor histidine kinase KdpD
MKASNLLRTQPPDTQGERTPTLHSPPDAAGRKRRGRLKIFLGAASGIGTTCEMIRAGITKHRERVDVVVGAVETRDRKETEALLK